MFAHSSQTAARLAGRAAIVLAALAAPASADTIRMQVVGVDWAKGGSLQFEVDGRPTTDFAGGIRIRLDSTPYEALCVDLFHSIGYETLAVNAFAPGQVENGWRAAWLYVNEYPGVRSPVAGEALQLAMWDIVHDDGNGLGTGRIRASAGVGTPAAVLAETARYLALSEGKSSGEASVYTMVQVPGTKQSLMSATRGGQAWIPPLDGVATPEPGGLALVGIGLVGVGLFRRYRRRGV